MAKVLELQLQHQSFQWIFRNDFLYNWPVWSPCNPRDSQEFLQHHSSKTSILKPVLQLSLIYGLTLTSIHDYGKNHSLTIWTIVGKGLCFLICCLGLSELFFQGASVLMNWFYHYMLIALPGFPCIEETAFLLLFSNFPLCLWLMTIGLYTVS